MRRPKPCMPSHAAQHSGTSRHIRGSRSLVGVRRRDVREMCQVGLHLAMRRGVPVLSTSLSLSASLPPSPPPLPRSRPLPLPLPLCLPLSLSPSLYSSLFHSSSSSLSLSLSLTHSSTLSLSLSSCSVSRPLPNTSCSWCECQ